MTVLLIDTHSVFFRAHYALPPMSTSSGEQTAALYGLSVLLLKLLREEKPSALAFARDLPRPTFRHERYPAYKANRPPVPDALRTQWARLDQLIEALRVPLLAAAGFEADDVLATVAQRLGTDRTTQIMVVSGDRDLFQVIRPNVRVLFIGARGQKPQLIDVAAVEQRYGVPPQQLPAVFALIGEAADNLQGVPGIGLRTASKLIARYENTASLIAALDQVTPEKNREALRAASERVQLNESLARLRNDLALEADPLVAPVSREAIQDLRKLFETLEFKSLTARLDALS